MNENKIKHDFNINQPQNLTLNERLIYTPHIESKCEATQNPVPSSCDKTDKPTKSMPKPGSIKSSCFPSSTPTLSAQTLSSFETSIVDIVAQPVISSIEERGLLIAEALSKYNLTNFNDEELRIVSSSLASHEKTNQLLEILATSETKSNGFLLLQIILLQSLLTASQNDINTLLNIYKKLFPFDEKTTGHPVSLKNIALILGDAYINDSGFEGDVSSRAYTDLSLEFLNTAPEKFSVADSLRYILQNPINVGANKSPSELKQELTKVLEGCPGDSKRCLLFGGWSQHAIVYEIEKKENNKYAFRVYNEGEGVNYHEKITANHKTKYAGCIALDEIPENLLLQPSFLASLQALCSSDGKVAPELLVSTILPLLGGKEEELPSGIQSYLSPQRSGICTYRSLQTFFAHVFLSGDYKKFKFQFKLFILNKFLPELNRLANIKVTADSYWETVKAYAVLKRCMEKYANSTVNISESIDSKDVNEANKKILEYNVLLQKLEHKILQHEKLSIEEIPSKAKEQVVKTSPSWTKLSEPSLSSTLPSKLLSNEELIAVDAIENIQDTQTSTNFSKAIEVCMPLINADALSDTMRWQLLDLLFKKIGSFKILSQVKFSNPQISWSILHSLYLKLVNSSHICEQEKLLISYGCYALAESAFRQLPEQTRLIKDDFVSFLTYLDLSVLKSATCCDPFWIRISDELQSINKKDNAPNLIPSLYDRSTTYNRPLPIYFSHSAEITQAILNLWHDPSKPWNLAQPTASSMQNDYNEKIKQISLKKDGLEKEKTRLQKLLSEMQEDINKNGETYLEKKAQNEFAKAQKHSDKMKYLHTRLDLINESLIEKNTEWEELSTKIKNIINEQKKIMSAIADANAADVKALSLKYGSLSQEIHKIEERQIVLILSLIEKKNYQANSLQDLTITNELNNYNKEIEKLISLNKKIPCPDDLNAVELKLLDLEMESEISELEINHLKSTKEISLTPLTINIQNDRFEQQSKTIRDIVAAKKEICELEHKKGCTPYRIKLHEKIQQLTFQAGMSDNFFDYERHVTENVRSMHPLFHLSQKIFFEHLYPYWQDCYYNPFQNNKCLELFKDPETIRYAQKQIDTLSLRITQLKEHPNEHEKDESLYWPYNWERGNLSNAQMASYLFGFSEELKEKLGSNEDVVPLEFKQFYNDIMLLKHPGRNKITENNLFPITYDKNHQSLTLTPTIVTPNPVEFNQYKSIAYSGCEAVDALNEYLPEEKIHHTMTSKYNLNDTQTLTHEKFVALNSIHQPNIQIEGIIHFFDENHDLLNNFRWVEIFHHLLFEKNLLLNELKTSPQNSQLLDRLNKSLNQWMEKAIQLDDITKIGYLIWTKSIVQRYIDEANLTNQEKLPTMFIPHDITEALKAVMHSQAKEYVLQIVFMSLTASASRLNFKNCSPEDFGSILILNVLRSTFGTESSIANMTQDCTLTEFEIHKYFSQNKNVKASDLFLPFHQQLLKKLYPNIDKLEQDIHQPDVLVNKNQSLRLCFSSGKLQWNDSYFMERYEYKPDNTTQKLLQEIGLCKTEEEFSSLRSCYLDGKIYTKKLPDGPVHTSFEIKTGVYESYLKIKQSDGTFNWMKWINPTEVFKYTGNRALCNNYFSLSAPDGTLYFFDKKDFSPSLKMDNTKLVDIKTGYHLAEPAKTFNAFEDLNSTAYWANDKGIIQNIDFTRLNLSFKRKNQEFECDQLPEWRLDQKQYAPHLGPSTGFIRLIHKDPATKKVTRKVFIPIWNALPMPKNQNGKANRALNFPYNFDFKAESQSSTALCEYDYAKGALIPTTLEARYYLAHIYLEKGYQDKAEGLLFDTQAEVTTRPLTADEILMLKRIVFGSQSGEISGRKVRLQLHALYLLKRCSTGADTKVACLTFDEQAVEKKLMDEYLSRLNHIKPLESRELTYLMDTHNQVDKTVRIEKQTPVTLKLPKDLSSRPEVYFQEKTSRIGDQAVYSYHRKKLSFPFDYTDSTVLLKEFPKYYPYLKKECQGITDLVTARDNGLIAMLYYLLNFSFNDKIKSAAKKLLNEIPATNTIVAEQIHKGDLFQVKEKKYPLMRKAFQSLPLLKDVKASDREKSFFPAAGVKYMNPEIHPSIKPPQLFEENHPRASEDQAIQSKFKQLNTNIHVASEMLSKEKQYNYVEEGLSDPLDETNDALRFEKQILINQKRFIIQNLSSALMSEPISSLIYCSGKTNLPNIEELSILCARSEAEKDLEINYPQLDSEGRKNLIEAVKQFLIQKRFVQHLERVHTKIIEIREGRKNGTISKETEKLMIQDLGLSIHQQPAYDTIHNPLSMVFLIIETTFNIKLREDQIENVKKFKAAIDRGDNVTIQMIMGSGKTSVLQPILALLFAVEGSLSTVYVPASLFAEVKRTLEKSLGKSFKKFVFADPFTKNLSKNYSFLQTYLNRLREAKHRRAIILLTPQDKYTLYSALKESYALNDPKRCDLLANICLECSLSEVAQIDEIDSCIDPTIIYRSPLGKSKHMIPERAKIITELVLELANDAALSEKVSIDFINSLNARKDSAYKIKGKPISSSIFEKEVKPVLVKKAQHLLAKYIPSYAQISSLDNQEYIFNFLNKSTPYDQEIRKHCELDKEEALRDRIESNQLIGVPQSDQTALELISKKIRYTQDKNAWIENHFGEYKQQIAICTKAINTILPQSLLKECGSNYSHDPKLITHGIYTARPYFAPNSPKPSIPSDSYESALYSLQNILFHGIPKGGVEKTLKRWQKDATLSGVHLFESWGYREFKRVLGDKSKQFNFSQDPPSEELIKLLKICLSKDTTSILTFMENDVFNQIVDFEDSLSTTPIAGLTGLNKQRIGYSATINPGILPQGMQVYPEAGTEGKIILTVNDKLDNEISKIREFSNQQTSYPNQVIDCFCNESDLFNFIDSGNWLKDVTLNAWVIKLATKICRHRSNIKGVVYPDEKGNWLSLEKDSLTQTWVSIPLSRSILHPEERVTIIPSKHETGTDIKQPPTAKALISVRKNMTLRDALQSIFRMRQILVGQKVDVAISNDVKDHICDSEKDKLTAKNLWLYFLFNQIDDHFLKSEISTIHKIQEAIEKPIRSFLENTKLPYAQRKSIFTASEKLFITKKIDDPFQEVCQVRRRVNIKRGVEYHIDRLINCLNFSDPAINYLFQNPAKLKEWIANQLDLTSLPKYMEIGGTHESQEIEIDIELEKEQEQEQEIERDIEIHKLLSRLESYDYKPLVPIHHGTYLPSDLLNLTLNPIENLLPQEIKPFFKQTQDLEYSVNLFPKNEIASGYHLPGRYLLVIKNKDQNERFVLVSHKDADLIKKGILNSNQHLGTNQSITLMTFDGEVSASIPPKSQIDVFDSHIQLIILHSKLLTGKIRFSPSELKHLEEDMIKPNLQIASGLKKLYENILSWMPDTLEKYYSSSIRKILNSLIKKDPIKKTTEPSIKIRKNRPPPTAVDPSEFIE